MLYYAHVQEGTNMKVKSLKITNVKSFKEETLVNFDNHFNIFVGPNGGGKSNLLDILTIVLRYVFLKGYNLTDIGNSRYKNIEQYTTFSDINSFLEKYIDNPTDGIINISLTVTKEDIDNIELFKTKKVDFENILERLTGQKKTIDLDFINTYTPGQIKPNQELKYTLKNNSLTQPSGGSLEQNYLQYLNYFEYFVLLATEIDEIEIKPILIYFSPYRGQTEPELSTTTGENYWSMLAGYYGSTSKSITTLAKIATLHFAKKRRKLEVGAETEGYRNKWQNDREVKLVKKYLDKLDYTWDLECTDPEKGKYQIVLTKSGRTFHINQASSGEKEILNFLLGIFSLDIHNGLVIIDEPELHLHPKWQDVLVDLFLELSIKTGNQFVISTHSPVFIKPTTLKNIIRIYKTKDNISRIIPIDKSNFSSSRDLLHIINTQNNEKMFFADNVVLVEGIKDRIIFKTLIDFFSNLGNNAEITEVIDVGSKTLLLRYRKFLNSIGVVNYIISDNDFIEDMANSEIKKLYETNNYGIAKDIINNKKNQDGQKLAQELEAALANCDCKSLKEFWAYIKSRKKQLKTSLSKDEQQELNLFLQNKKKEKIFILTKGELEDYLPKNSISIDQVMELVKEPNFYMWFLTNSQYLLELKIICCSILGIKKRTYKVVQSKLEYLSRKYYYSKIIALLRNKIK